MNNGSGHRARSSKHKARGTGQKGMRSEEEKTTIRNVGA